MIFVTADLHLDHKNIIKYCTRPFTSVDEMNLTLLANWNSIVKKNDTVFVVGDFAMKNAKYWLAKLNGKKFIIQGNHDKLANFKRSELIYKGEKFLLVHRPTERNGWDGWTIHGHVHNNFLSEYPFINPEKKTINVGVELTGYMPVSLEFLVRKIHEGVGFWESMV